MESSTKRTVAALTAFVERASKKGATARETEGGGQGTSYYKVCPYCRAHLAPGERCDCRENVETPASAANAGGGGVGQGLDDAVSTSHNTREPGDFQV